MELAKYEIIVSKSTALVIAFDDLYCMLALAREEQFDVVHFLDLLESI